MIKEYCDISTKKAVDLAMSIRGRHLKEVIELPKYQRNLVWTKSKKENFIKSLKLGFPVGAILLHKQNEVDGKTKYLIIDGLQRTTTILNYYEDPTSYDLSTDLSYCEKEMNVLLSKMNSIDLSLEISDLKELILKYIASDIVVGFAENKGYSSFLLNKFLSDSLKIKIELEKLNTEYSNLLAEIKSKADIEDIKIPVIEYSGPSENLPDIFTRLNTQGTQLNKYQIYAAMWERSRLDIKNIEIIELIKKKYEDINNKGLSIEIIEDENSSEKYNVFEYLYGLGKYILLLKNEKYRILFKTDSGEINFEDVESFIFVITQYLYQLQSNEFIVKMEDLDKFVSGIKQKDFEEAIIHCIDETFNILSPILNFSLNQNKNKTTTFSPPSEIQIISIIISIYKYIYNNNFKKEKIDSSKYEKLKRNIYLYYWYDICDGKWDRSTDTQLLNTIRNDRYHDDISIKSWDLLMDKYFNEQLSKQHRERTLISKKDILFMKYLYANIISAKQENSKVNYQIDHIIPVSVLKNKAKSNETSLPISAIGNLCLLEEKINKDKGDKFLNEFLNTLDDKLKKKYKSIIEKVTFMKIDDLKVVERKNLSEDNFINFLNDRHEKMKINFYKLNDID